MAKEKVLFKSEEPKSLGAVADFLRQFADRLSDQGGEVVLKKGAEEFRMSIPSSVVLELKAEEEPKKTRLKRSFEIEIEWYEGEDSGPVTLG